MNWNTQVETNLKCRNVLAIEVPLIERLNAIATLYTLGLTWSLPTYLWNLTIAGIDRIESIHPLSLQEFTQFQGNSLSRVIQAISFIRDYPESGLFILENLQALINSQATSLLEQEELKAWIIDTLCSLSLTQNKYLILLDIKEIGLPQALTSIIPTIALPLPDAQQLQELLQQIYPNLDDETNAKLQLVCAGLTIEEIKVGAKRAAAVNNPDVATSLLDYKIERLKTLGLDFIPKPNVSDFGGMDRIKTGIEEVRTEFLPVARRYKIPFPKGWLLAGVPGTGKTFASQICAQILGFPLINVGADVVKSGGAAFLKRLLMRIEACSPAVCFFDEFDKFFSADQVTGEDSQSKQILGILLTWLQEKRSPTFVIATLNRLDALPPELTRAGRFDKIYYVGFPQAIERKEIFQLHASKFDPRWKFDETCPLSHEEWMILLGKTQNFTGAEIRALVESAAKKVFHSLYESFGSQLEEIESPPPIHIGLEQLLEQRKEFTSLYSRDTERVLAMENRAKYVAKPASSPDESQFSPPLTSYWGDHQPID